MKLEQSTLSVLKSFTTINQSIFIEAGNTIQTISPQKTIMAKAVVDDTFDKTFAIYDLSQFLSAVSLFEDPDFKFEDQYVTISNNASSIRYWYADQSIVKQPTNKDIKLPDSIVKFNLSNDDLKSALQAANVLQSPNWSVVGDGSRISIQVGDEGNSTSNKFKIDVGTTEDTFNLVFKVENLKIMLNTYTVEISSKGISHFASTDGKVQYFIATETR